MHLADRPRYRRRGAMPPTCKLSRTLRGITILSWLDVMMWAGLPASSLPTRYVLLFGPSKLHHGRDFASRQTPDNIRANNRLGDQKCPRAFLSCCVDCILISSLCNTAPIACEASEPMRLQCLFLSGRDAPWLRS